MNTARLVSVFILLLAVGSSASAGKPNCSPWPACKGGGSSDTTPPGPINGLSIKAHTDTSMVLRWIAPGDDGLSEGTVDHYDIRRAAQGATCPEFPSDFDWTLEVPVFLTWGGQDDDLRWPFSAQGVHHQVVDHLEPSTCYAFEIEAFDEAANPSGPSYTTGTTDVPIEDSPWGLPEVVIAEHDYRHNQALAFDPRDGRPAFLISDEGAQNTRYEKKSADGTWTEEIVESSRCKRGAILAFSTLTRNAEGLIVRCASKGKKKEWAFVERFAAGNWDETLIVPRDYLSQASQEGGNWIFSYDANGLRVIALRLDQQIQLVRLDEAPLSPEVIFSAGNPYLTGLRFNPLSGYPAVAFLSYDSTTDTRLGYLAEFDGTDWNFDIVKVEAPGTAEFDSFSFAFDPNGEPLFLYRNAKALKMARRDLSGAWVETIIPRIVPYQMGQVGALEYRADSTIFALLVGSGGGAGEIFVGRFCESGLGFACESVWAEHDIWVIERAYATIGDTLDSVSFAFDPDGLPAVGLADGSLSPAGWSTLLYARCRLGISQVCEPLPSP